MRQDHDFLRHCLTDVMESLVSLMRAAVLRGTSVREHIVSHDCLELLTQLKGTLADLIATARVHCCVQTGEDAGKAAHRSAKVFVEDCLASIAASVDEDLRAAYAADPAATSFSEVALCYPGFEAVACYRISHELLRLGVPLIPRMITEQTHCKTGVDIHPRASIGPGFFIDHATGVVIGETAQIGRNVTLYHGVTLGALSLPRDSAGNIIRGLKRHPTLENNVVVYANATILGGNTVIGHDSVIGSNVWLTRSVDPRTVVSQQGLGMRFTSQAGRPLSRPVQEVSDLDTIMGADYYPA